MMTRRTLASRKASAVLAVAVLLPLVVGCGSSSSSKRPTVTLLVPDLTAPYWASAVKGAKAAAASDGVDLMVAGTPAFTASQYNAQIQDVIQRGTQGLLIGPEDPTTANGLIAKATKQGITVGTVVVDAPTSPRKFFIGPNAPLLGQGQAQRALSVLHATHAIGTIQAAITSCAPTALSQVQERQAFTQTVEHQNPYAAEFTVKVVTFLNATSDASTSLSLYNNLATAYPQLKLLFPMCSLDAESAGTTAKRRHTGWIVAADGWVPGILQLARQGFVSFVVNEEPYETLAKAVGIMATGIKHKASFPSGAQSFPLDVAVKTPGQWPMPGAGKVVSITQALTSPDAG